MSAGARGYEIYVRGPAPKRCKKIVCFWVNSGLGRYPLRAHHGWARSGKKMGLHGPKTPFSFNFTCTSGLCVDKCAARFREQMDQRCACRARDTRAHADQPSMQPNDASHAHANARVKQGVAASGSNRDRAR